jgi:Protein of unknown function (DUF3135)
MHTTTYLELDPSPADAFAAANRQACWQPAQFVAIRRQLLAEFIEGPQRNQVWLDCLQNAIEQDRALAATPQHSLRELAQALETSLQQLEAACALLAAQIPNSIRD